MASYTFPLVDFPLSITFFSILPSFVSPLARFVLDTFATIIVETFQPGYRSATKSVTFSHETGSLNTNCIVLDGTSSSLPGRMPLMSLSTFDFKTRAHH